MLPTLRQVVGQPARIIRRRLATIVPTALNEAGTTTSIQSHTQGTSTSKQVMPKVVDPIEPVYLTMSGLLLEKKKHVGQRAVALDPTIFGHPIRRDILHLCVVHYLDSLRQGTASTKTRGEVRGSNRKIRPQKGTGRARLGERQSPMLRGGGVAFGPKPRDFSTKLNRKVLQMGLRVALALKVKEQRLGVVDNLHWLDRKTASLNRRLKLLGWETGTLFVTGEETVPANIKIAGNNLPGVDFRTIGELQVYDLVKWRRVVLDMAAVQSLERTLSKGWSHEGNTVVNTSHPLVASPAAV
ncbi:ribosomal protein L4 domain-containing protein [Hygrophoropsis aurantiaca]|uniref:Ribosomal protein L4 domain-containing protein n=1 Tax=Hygrophoropsis aurantiaca TaxID=72124 RepID=A0ACB8AIC7_9AGAM|nr:ribosomal protein L4 domain-containing protein [Hygrophoropsis aurantiaca]